MKTNQKGFSIVGILLILVAIGVIGFAGWSVWQKRNNAQKVSQKGASDQRNDTTSETAEQGKSDSTKTIYRNDQIGFSFSYPKDWLKITGAQYYDESLISLRSPAAQASVDSATFSPRQEYLRSQMAYGSTLMVMRAAEESQIKDLQNLIKQYDDNISCPTEIGINSPQPCRGLYHLIGAFEASKGVKVYEAIEGGHGRNYALAFKHNNSYVLMSFRYADTKNDLNATDKEIISSIKFL